MNLSVPAVAENTSGTSSVRDVLDVSLHDDELAAELELIALLMVAANETSQRLSREAVDGVLGVGLDIELPSQVTPRGRGAADAGRAP